MQGNRTREERKAICKEGGEVHSQKNSLLAHKREIRGKDRETERRGCREIEREIDQQRRERDMTKRKERKNDKETRERERGEREVGEGEANKRNNR